MLSENQVAPEKMKPRNRTTDGDGDEREDRESKEEP
jgi:hypothetical protein